jgi:hypothetical protein
LTKQLTHLTVRVFTEVEDSVDNVILEVGKVFEALLELRRDVAFDYRVRGPCGINETLQEILSLHGCPALALP